MLRRLSITALILAGACTLASADVYRWVDDKGEPHYSDQWVPGSQVIKTTTKAHPSGPEAAAHVSDQKTLAATNERIANQLSDQDNARAVQEDKAKRREALCKQARDAYTQAITSRRIYKDASGGERSYLSDDEADKYREGLRKSVQENCGSVPQIDMNAPIPEPQPIPEPRVNPAAATSQ